MENKQVLKGVEGERNSITYLIQKIDSDVSKLINNDAVIDIHIQNEIMKLKDRMNNFEILCNTRFKIIQNSSTELLKTVLQKL